MVYTANKPLGSDSIKESDDIIRANFTHIVAAFNQEHVWDANTATNCIHDATMFKTYFGQFSRALNGSAGDVAVTGIGFVPQAVLFFAVAHGDTSTLITSNGGSNGVNSGCVFYLNLVPTLGQQHGSNGTYCILLCDGGTSKYQRAVWKSFDADGFTLTWSTSSMTSSNNAGVFFVALRFSA